MQEKLHTQLESDTDTVQVKTMNPLVSIIVITYNSSKYVLETLESAKAQTYQNIELVVSDDCSTDDTVEICRKWIELNKSRFVRTELIVAIKNSGIAPNCNRGINLANGEWLKLIAGDDILYNNCIKINIENTYSTEAKFFFSKFHVLSGNSEDIVNTEKAFEDKYYLFNGNQFDNFMNVGYYFPTITFFANKNEVFKVGLYNENYPFHEDLPMWFKILKKGYRFSFIDDYTVQYRIHNNSIFNDNKQIISPLWFKSSKKFYYKEYFKENIKRKQFLKVIDRMVLFLYYDMSIKLGNKRGILNNICKSILLLSPTYVINKVKQLFHS